MGVLDVSIGLHLTSAVVEVLKWMRWKFSGASQHTYPRQVDCHKEMQEEHHNTPAPESSISVVMSSKATTLQENFGTACSARKHYDLSDYHEGRVLSQQDAEGYFINII